MADQSYFLILYDITDDRRRTRLHKLLESFGAGFQLSVFEARLSEMQRIRLEHGIKRVINKEEDKVAVVKLCQNCLRTVSLIGQQKTVICQNAIIV